VKGDFAVAGAAFEAFEDDQAAALLASRCSRLATTPPTSDWDGVATWTSK